jgi:glycosyltransferase involved in cell wall biosynthesis
MTDEAAVVLERTKVTMVGAFPPPLHGMAAVNAAVLRDLTNAGGDPFVVNIAAQSLDRGLWSRLGRVPSVLSGLFTLAFARNFHSDVLYMSVSGGGGQIYELFFVLLARARGLRTFLHHHSFAYLDRRGRLTAALVWAAGKSTCHIALSHGMACRLRSIYPGVGSVVSVSNAVLLLSENGSPPPPKSRLQVLGFLSNISVEKGAHEFLDVCAALQELGLPVSARLAGPFQDEEVEQSVRQRLMQLPGVTYVGPIYGADKTSFFSGIDVLLFPTRYANEAEPLTIHEAMSACVPIIAYGRGAIPEILTPECGKVVPVGDDFTSSAMEQIVAWHAAPNTLQAASLAASSRFAILRAENARHWEALKVKILGENSPGVTALARELSSSDQSD